MTIEDFLPKPKKIAFLFPGQGAQAVGMASDLYREFDVAREVFDMAEEITRINLSRLCFNGPADELTRTVNLQPALTAVNLACLAVIGTEDITPCISAGHSLGEYAALAASGAVSAPDTLRLVSRRGRLMDREAGRNPGLMHAIIGLGIDDVRELIENAGLDAAVAIANHNAEKQIVISGIPGPVETVSAAAAKQGARALALRVSGAWHSELMRGAVTEFSAALDEAAFHKPGHPVLMNVTASPLEAPDEIKSVMKSQLCSPVRWYDSMCRLRDEGITHFAEVGAGRVLAGLLKRTLPEDYPGTVHSVNSMKSLEAFFRDVA